MSFVWVAVDDPPGADSARGTIEANAIGLLSNRGKPDIDTPSAGWLGHSAASPAIRECGLWNVDHVDRGYEPDFLGLLASRVRS